MGPARKLKTILGALVAAALAATLVPVSASAEHGIAQNYMFNEAFTGRGDLRVVGDVSAAPVTGRQSYGANISAQAVGESRTFEFDVAETGSYEVSFRGYRYYSAGIGALVLDGETIGDYDFYDPGSTYGPTVALGERELSAGTHTLTFEVIGRNPAATQNSNYSMYPSELILTPEAALTLSVDGKSRLLVDEVAGLEAGLAMSDGTPVSDQNITFASSDEAVATVAADGTVRALAPGRSTITVTGHGNGATAVEEVPIEVTDATLASISLSLDPAQPQIGGSAQIVVTGTLSDGTAADLRGATFAYQSSNPDVVPVDAEGRVSAAGAGRATVTVTAEFVGVSADASIEVEPTERAEKYYSFADSFTGVGDLRIVGDPEATPITRRQSYGASVSATAVGQARSFEFDVPATGLYLLTFEGYLYFSSSIGDIIVDGEKIGTYDFYTDGSEGGPATPVRTLELTEGTHTITLEVSGRNPDATQNSNYSMYPTSLTLTPQSDLPTMGLTASAKPRLVVGETAAVEAELAMTDGTPVPDPQYTFTSSDGAVVTVDEVGTLTGVGAGEATITVTGTSGEQVLERQVAVEVTDATLETITVALDKPALEFGETAQVVVTGTLTDGSAADLSGATIGYASSDPSVVGIDADGVASGLRPGTSDITVEVSFVNVELTETLRLEVSDQITNKKTRATIYTEAEVTAARHNAQTYNWAKQQRDAAVAKADAYLRNGTEFLWALVPPQSLPRSYAVNQTMGSPVTGTEIDEYGKYPYTADPYTEPWKITDPSSGYKFPTNDFESYYESGLDEHGIFNRELADPQFLVNELYPEMGPTWGVDDGLGWTDDDGNTFPFIAYYVHWFLWHGEDSTISNANVALRDAYLYTGDMKYARAGMILLDRIADVYPSLDVAAYDQTIFLNSHGGLNTGKTVGSQWEELLLREYIHAYDAYYPVMDDPETVAFLQQKSQELDQANPKNSGDALRRHIEDNIVMQAMPAVSKAQIHSVNGRHANVLTQAAVVYDTMPQTQEWLDFAFQHGGLTGPPRQVLGGSILSRLVDQVDRDGAGTSGAPEYNLLWLARYIRMADTLRGYDKYPAADLFDNVKFKKLFSNIFSLILSDRYLPSFGDSKQTGNPGIFGINMTDMVAAFQHYREPIYAQVAYFLNGNTVEGINGGMFSTDVEQLMADVQAVIDEHGPLDLKSDNQAGYGFAALRDGVGDPALQSTGTLRDFWLYYGRNYEHGHRDTLNLGVHAFGLDLAPDLGYPEFGDNLDMNRFQWVNNTISHNTVVVDESKQQQQYVGDAKHFDDDEMVKLVDLEAPNVYPQTDLYKRTTAMIKVDEENSYSVDFFRVKGGDSHHFSFHGAEGAVTTEGLDLVEQPTGTYAGPDVEFGERVDDIDGHRYQGHGFHWLKNVERASDPSASFSVDWNVRDTWNVYGAGVGAQTDVHLRLTMMGDVDEVALADGVPPQNREGNPEALRYLVAKRTGTDLDSVFTSVVEPYKGERYVESIEQVPVTIDGQEVTGTEVRAVKVVLGNGRTDYVVNSTNPGAAYMVDGTFAFQGFFGVYSEVDGEPVRSYLNDGTTIGDLEGPGALDGTVVDFTRDVALENQITVELDQEVEDLQQLVGAYVYVETDGLRNGAYRIEGATADGDRVVLDVGDTTLIRSYVDPADPERGFNHNIAEGASLRIPLGVSSGDDEPSGPKPTAGSLSHDNGHDTGLQDGSYTITHTMWWGENADRIRLLEDGEVVAEETLTASSPNAQSASFEISGRGNGEYTYTAELISSGGVTTTAPLVVRVTDANPAKPVLSSDNWDKDGDYTVTANLWWGTNATSYVVLENGVQIADGTLTAATPKAQRASISLADKPAGEYTYVFELRNDAGATSSAPLTVTVR